MSIRAHFAILAAASAVFAASSASFAAPGHGSVTATFMVKNAGTKWGQSVYVVGDQPGLGKWDPSKGLPLKIRGDGKNATWVGSTSLPSGSTVQYKYVKWDGNNAEWEGDQATHSKNREVHTPAHGTATFDDGSFKKPKAKAKSKGK